MELFHTLINPLIMWLNGTHLNSPICLSIQFIVIIGLENSAVHS